jgi:hypothetical protein
LVGQWLATQAVSLRKQWIRSPMFGFVSEVRVKSVTVEGVTLELKLQEMPSLKMF